MLSFNPNLGGAGAGFFCVKSSTRAKGVKRAKESTHDWRLNEIGQDLLVDRVENLQRGLESCTCSDAVRCRLRTLR
jgi:hypothetical protein